MWSGGRKGYLADVASELGNPQSFSTVHSFEQ
jgi:hypothetical protein